MYWLYASPCVDTELATLVAIGTNCTCRTNYYWRNNSTMTTPIKCMTGPNCICRTNYYWRNKSATTPIQCMAGTNCICRTNYYWRNKSATNPIQCMAGTNCICKTNYRWNNNSVTTTRIKCMTYYIPVLSLSALNHTFDVYTCSIFQLPENGLKYLKI